MSEQLADDLMESARALAFNASSVLGEKQGLPVAAVVILAASEDGGTTLGFGSSIDSVADLQTVLGWMQEELDRRAAGQGGARPKTGNA